MTNRCCSSTRCGFVSETGSSLIELALVLPVFLLLVFGFINFAMITFGVCNMTYASRAALRYASLHSSTSFSPAGISDINNIVNPFLFKYPANTTQTALTYGGGNIVGSTVTVTVTITYNVVLPGYTYRGLALSTAAQGVVIQ